MECASCGSRWNAARFCGRCGGLLAVPDDAAGGVAAPPHEGGSEVGRVGAELPQRLMGLGLALAVVAVGAWLVAPPPAENAVDLPPVAAGEADRESAPATERRQYVESSRVIDCSPALEEIGETIVRQMRRAKLVERHGNQLCLVLTDDVPSRPAATESAPKALIASARFPRADDCAADLDGIAVETARRGTRPCFVLDDTHDGRTATAARLNRRSTLR